MLTAHDRALIDSADRHLARSARCAHCERAVDPDTAPEASAAVAAHLGVAVQALLCTRCDLDAREDLGPAPVDTDAQLAADPDFVTVLDARSDARIEAQESDAEAELAQLRAMWARDEQERQAEREADAARAALAAKWERRLAVEPPPERRSFIERRALVAGIHDARPELALKHDRFVAFGAA